VVRLEAEVTILRRLAELPGGGPDRERIYGFVDAHSGELPVGLLCRVCKVSRSAFYAWRAGRDRQVGAGVPPLDRTVGLCCLLGVQGVLELCR